MYIDKQNSFCSSQAVTASAPSTDYIDLGAARDIGVSDGLQVLITVNTTATAAGAATVAFSLEKDSSSAFGSAVAVTSTAAIGKATLVAGYQFYLPIPIGTDARYLRVYFTVATGPLTAGAFSAAIVKGEQKNISYADAI